MLAIFQPQGEPLAKNSHTIEDSKGQQANAERADKAKANSGVKLRNCFGIPLNMGKSRFLSCHRVYISVPAAPTSVRWLIHYGKNIDDGRFLSSP